jgi:protein-tyrosine phosphatase
MNHPHALTVTALAAALFAHAALAGPVAMPKVERTAPGEVVISWTGDNPVDVYVADRPDATIAQAKLVSDDDRDGRHELQLASNARTYFILKNDNGSTLKVAERLLPLERGSNFRDLGGYPAAGGKRIRWGKIYRSGATAMLSDWDIAYVDGLGISSMIDLRSVEERKLAPTAQLAGRTGAHYIATDYSMAPLFARLSAPNAEPVGTVPVKSMYRDWLTSLAPQYKAIFEELLANNVILADYHLSTAYRRPEHEMPTINAAAHPGNPVALYFAKAQESDKWKTPRPLYSSEGTPHLAEALDEIDTQWGSVETYLDRVLGIDEVEIAALRATYLE